MQTISAENAIYLAQKSQGPFSYADSEEGHAYVMVPSVYGPRYSAIQRFPLDFAFDFGLSIRDIDEIDTLTRYPVRP